MSNTYGAEIVFGIEVAYYEDGNRKYVTMNGIESLDDDQMKELCLILKEYRTNGKIIHIQMGYNVLVFVAFENDADEISQRIKDAVFYDFDDLYWKSWCGKTKMRRDAIIA